MTGRGNARTGIGSPTFDTDKLDGEQEAVVRSKRLLRSVANVTQAQEAACSLGVVDASARLSGGQYFN